MFLFYLKECRRIGKYFEFELTHEKNGLNSFSTAFAGSDFLFAIKVTV